MPRHLSFPIYWIFRSAFVPSKTLQHGMTHIRNYSDSLCANEPWHLRNRCRGTRTNYKAKATTSACDSPNQLIFPFGNLSTDHHVKDADLYPLRVKYCVKAPRFPYTSLLAQALRRESHL